MSTFKNSKQTALFNVKLPGCIPYEIMAEFQHMYKQRVSASHDFLENKHEMFTAIKLKVSGFKFCAAVNVPRRPFTHVLSPEQGAKEIISNFTAKH